MKTITGFTLIELMVVITIIGILASTAMPSYQAYIVRAQVTEALTMVSELQSYTKEYYKATGRFPKNNASAKLPAKNQLMGNYVSEIRIENGAFHVELGHKVNQALEGKLITVRPAVVKGSPLSPFSWLCGHSHVVDGMEAIGDNKTNIEEAYLPSSCRDFRN